MQLDLNRSNAALIVVDIQAGVAPGVEASLPHVGQDEAVPKAVAVLHAASRMGNTMKAGLRMRRSSGFSLISPGLYRRVKARLKEGSICAPKPQWQSQPENRWKSWT